MTPNTDDRIRDAIRRELEVAIEKAVQAEIAAAQKRIEVEIRKSVATFAASMLSRYDITRDGQDLVIRVRIGEGNAP